MFWKRNQKTSLSTITNPATVMEAGSTTINTVITSPKNTTTIKAEKLPGPRQIPAILEQYLATVYKIDVALIRILKIAIRKKSQQERAFDFRIFDHSEAEVKGVIVHDYTSLDENQDLIIFEGWFNEDSKMLDVIEKRKIATDIPFLTETEILQQIEALREPGGSAFFYQNAGPAIGGPLGRGAVVVELNPLYPGKKQHKYNIYTVNVVGMEPVAKRNLLYSTDKLKDLARWIKQSYQKRIY